MGGGDAFGAGAGRSCLGTLFGRSARRFAVSPLDDMGNSGSSKKVHPKEAFDAADTDNDGKGIGPLLPGGGATLRTLTSLGGGV